MSTAAFAVQAAAQASPAHAPATTVPSATGRWAPSILRAEAERWYASGHRSPDQRPAAWHVFRALQQAGRIVGSPADKPRQAIATSGGSWQLAGPLPLNTAGSTDAGLPTQDYGNISGRISALALDPSDPTGNTLWVGAANGGVWKCAHALSSATCTPKTDAQASLSTGAIAINPSSGTIYVGTGEGIAGAVDQVYGQGILTSTDGGDSWNLVTSADGGAENLFGLAFSRILVDPTNPQIIVAATEGGLGGFGWGTPTSLQGQTFNWTGIYRSTDGGATWSLAFPPTAGGVTANATDLAYDPACRCYYAAFKGNGLWKSTDQGASWSSLPSPFPSGANVSSTQSATNFGTAKLSVRGGILYSVIADGTGDLSAPSACAVGQTSGCDTGIQQSSDGGQTWSPIAAPPTNSAGDSLFCEITNTGKDCQGWYDVFLVAPAGGSNLVVGGLDAYMAASVNGTNTNWTDIENSYSNLAGLVHGDNHVLVAVNSNTWFIGTDGGLWGTQDAGSTWTNQNATLGNIQFYGVSADPTNSGVWLAGAQDNGTSKSLAGNTVWNRVYLGDGGFTAINSNKSSQYFVEYPGVIMRFDDGAVTMTNNVSTVVDISYTQDAEAFIQPYHLLPHDQTSILMGTCRIWEGPTITASDGAGWKAISNDLTGGGSGSSNCQQNGNYIRDVEAGSTTANPNVDSVIYAVTTDDHVAVSQNANTSTPTFSDVSGNGLPADASLGHPFSSVAINPVDSATAYVTVQGFGMGHVFKTSNYGASWIDITGNLPDAPANWILVDPQNTKNVYVATMTGVYVAADGGVSGETWTQMGTGLPNADVMQLALSTTSPRMLGAATHGRGLWTIAPLQASGPATPDFSISVSNSSASVVAGTNATLVVNTAGLSGDTANITLSCNAPSTGCSFSPSVVAPGGSSSLIISANSLVVGTNTIVVNATDGTNTHTASATVTVTSAVPNFNITLTPSSTSINAGTNAAITVNTAAVNGDTASIKFQCTQPVSGCSFSPATVTPGGSATLTVAASALSLGSNTIDVSATDGTNTQTASTSITVNAAPDFSMSASPATVSVNPGQSASFTLTLTPSGGFNAAISLSCSGAPSGASCSIAPNSVTPSGASATATVTITTIAPSSAAVTSFRSAQLPPGVPGPSPWKFAVLGAGLFPLLLHRVRKAWAARGWILGTLAILFTLLSACGSGSNTGSGSGTTPSNPGTPSGTSTITLTGTSGALSHSTNVTLTVN